MAEVEISTSMEEDVCENVDETLSVATADELATIPHQLVAIPITSTNGQIVYHIVPQYCRSETCVTVSTSDDATASTPDNSTVADSGHVINAGIVTPVDSDSLPTDNSVTLNFSASQQMSTASGNSRPAKWSLVRRDAQLQTQTRAMALSAANKVETGNRTLGTVSTRRTESFSPGDLSDDGAGGNRSSRRSACTCPNCRDGINRSIAGLKKEHVCHFCNKVYGKTSHLRAHIRWHTGDRPYSCDWIYCNKKFTRSDELQRHLRTHTGEKKFECMFCGKKFMRSDHLAKHSMTHMKGGGASNS